MGRGSRLWLLLFCLCALARVAEARPVVAVLEYRAGAKGAAGVGERVAGLLAASASVDVISLVDARRKEVRIDAQVARCSGDASCIAGLGGALGASEVLLVGVSQLGDLVLSLQRIDVAKGQVAARLAESVGQDDSVADAQIQGWLKRLFPPDWFKRFGRIRVVSDTDGAEVSLDGVSQGVTPVGELRVRAPASYKVTLHKAGFAPFEAGIDLLPDATIEVRASLQRTASKTPLWKRWYLWAGVGAVVAGVGIGVGAYLGTRVDPNPLGYLVTPAPSGTQP
jgi:hypothetical protein